MTKKRMPSDHEIASLADSFRELWTPGDDIRTWLRKQSVLMLDLVHGDWSWAALAVVLTKAGITYRTGTAWTTDSLRQESARATAPLKGYARRRTEVAKTNDDEGVPSVPVMPQRLPQHDTQISSVAPIDPTTDHEGSEFKFVKLANWSGTTSQPGKRAQQKEPVEQVSASDVDAMVARLTGGKSS